MKKNEILILEKLKCSLQISSLNIPHLIKTNLEFYEHYFIIKFLELEKNKKIKMAIEKIFLPLYRSKLNENNFYINYTLIKHSSIVDYNSLKIIMYNCKESGFFTLNFTNIEIIGLIFKKKMNFESLNNLNRKLTNLINLEIKYLIGQFLFLFTLLRDCLDPKKKENNLIEEILFKSYVAGKNYYEKYINELKKNSKLKNGIKKIVIEKINKLNLLQYYKNNNKRNINKICDEESESEEENNNNSEHMENYIENNMNYSKTFNEKNIELGSFDSLINEFKLRTSINIEESIVLFFKVVSVDSNKIFKSFKNSEAKSISISLKSANEREKKIKLNNLLNKGNYSNNIRDIKHNYFSDNLFNYDDETFSNSTKNTSKKNEKKKEINDEDDDIPQTPKFNFKNSKNDSSMNESVENINVNQLINECKKSHLFLPPNENFNIFFNTTEIIHRKFFEIFFDEFIGKIFTYEKDKDNLIKLDSLYNFFIYLKNLKNILFVEKNRIYFSNVFFMDEEDE